MINVFNKIKILVLKQNLLPISDETYLKKKFKIKLGRELNLKNPQTLNEKLQVIKLYDRKDIYTTMVDKVAVKKYVETLIDKKYVIPTFFVYNNVDEINIEKLPNKFVMKSSHNSGNVVICENKEKFNLKKAKKILKKSLKDKYYLYYREYPYKNVTPKIIVEEYLGANVKDYKIQCFNGKVDNILVCTGRNTKEGVKYFYFDTNWNYLDYCPYENGCNMAKQITKPKKLKEMIEIAETLSKGLPEIRVDLYYVNNKIYFGELTLFTNAGFDNTITYTADLIMGSKLDLGDIKNEN